MSKWSDKSVTAVGLMVDDSGELILTINLDDGKSYQFPVGENELGNLAAMINAVLA